MFNVNLVKILQRSACFNKCYKLSGPQKRMRNEQLFFLFLNKNICCVYSKEPSFRLGFQHYLQDPADFNAMKNMFDLYIVKPYLHYYVNMPIQYILQCFRMTNCDLFLYPPQTLFVVGILFSRCPSVRASVRACVRRPFCLLNILKSHC